MRAPSSAPKKSRRELYKEKYEASKQGGKPFYPDTIFKDAVVALALVAVIIVLAILFPATSEPPADPTSTTYNPRPEWYFLFFFQFLKLFPGSLESVAAVIIPIIAVVILFLTPFLDRGFERSWSHRKPAIGIGVMVVAVLVALEVAGAASAPARPAGEQNLLVQQGQKVYREIACSYCHSINGVGGSIGPDLTAIAGKLGPQDLARYLQNPHAMVPSTLHPKLQFTPDELDALVAYLGTLGAQVSYSAEAPNLFNKQCSVCHLVNGKGGTIGPDLSSVGSRRTLSFLEAYTADPKAVLPGATMPAFKSVLTPAEINDIAAYMYNLKGQTPAPVTKP